jgi:hypothetical protein
MVKLYGAFETSLRQVSIAGAAKDDPTPFNAALVNGLAAVPPSGVWLTTGVGWVVVVVAVGSELSGCPLPPPP